jgi:hypothetical protein
MRCCETVSVPGPSERFGKHLSRLPALVNDATALLAALADVKPDEAAQQALALLALVAGQDVEPADGSDGTDGRWRIARKVAEDRVVSTVDRDARHTRKSPRGAQRRLPGTRGRRPRHRHHHRRPSMCPLVIDIMERVHRSNRRSRSCSRHAGKGPEHQTPRRVTYPVSDLWSLAPPNALAEEPSQIPLRPRATAGTPQPAGTRTGRNDGSKTQRSSRLTPVSQVPTRRSTSRIHCTSRNATKRTASSNHADRPTGGGER